MYNCWRNGTFSRRNVNVNNFQEKTRKEEKKRGKKQAEKDLSVVNRTLNTNEVELSELGRTENAWPRDDIYRVSTMIIINGASLRARYTGGREGFHLRSRGYVNKHYYYYCCCRCWSNLIFSFSVYIRQFTVISFVTSSSSISPYLHF